MTTRAAARLAQLSSTTRPGEHHERRSNALRPLAIVGSGWRRHRRHHRGARGRRGRPLVVLVEREPFARGPGGSHAPLLPQAAARPPAGWRSTSSGSRTTPGSRCSPRPRSPRTRESPGGYTAHGRPDAAASSTTAARLCGRVRPARRIARRLQLRDGQGTKAVHLPHLNAWPQRFAIDRAACPARLRASASRPAPTTRSTWTRSRDRGDDRGGRRGRRHGWPPYDAEKLTSTSAAALADVVDQRDDGAARLRRAATGGKIIRPSDGRSPQARGLRAVRRLPRPPPPAVLLRRLLPGLAQAGRLRPRSSPTPRSRCATSTCARRARSRTSDARPAGEDVTLLKGKVGQGDRGRRAARHRRGRGRRSAGMIAATPRTSWSSPPGMPPATRLPAASTTTNGFVDTGRRRGAGRRRRPRAPRRRRHGAGRHRGRPQGHPGHGKELGAWRRKSESTSAAAAASAKPQRRGAGLDGAEGGQGRSQTHACLCGEEGNALIRDDVANEGVNTVVIAACSARAMTDAFRFDVPILERVNLREHVAWSHEPKTRTPRPSPRTTSAWASCAVQKTSPPEPIVRDLEDRSSWSAAASPGWPRRWSAAELRIRCRWSRSPPPARRLARRRSRTCFPTARPIADLETPPVAEIARRRAGQPEDPRHHRRDHREDRRAARPLRRHDQDARPARRRPASARSCWPPAARPYDAAKLAHLGYGASPGRDRRCRISRRWPPGASLARPPDGKSQERPLRPVRRLARRRTTSPTARPPAAGHAQAGAQIRQANPEAEGPSSTATCAPLAGRVLLRSGPEPPGIFDQGRGRVQQRQRQAQRSASRTRSSGRRPGEADLVVLATGMVPNTADGEAIRNSATPGQGR